MTRSLPKAIRRIPALWASLCHLALLGVAMALFMGRTKTALRSDTILDIAPTFYSHVSNLGIAYLLCAGIGYAWLMMGVRRSHVLLFCLAVGVCNVVYEWWLPILNTRDPMDAWYGLAGTAAAALVLGLIDRFGMGPVPGSPGQGSTGPTAPGQP